MVFILQAKHQPGLLLPFKTQPPHLETCPLGMVQRSAWPHKQDPQNNCIKGFWKTTWYQTHEIWFLRRAKRNTTPCWYLLFGLRSQGNPQILVPFLFQKRKPRETARCRPRASSRPWPRLAWEDVAEVWGVQWVNGLIGGL